MAAFRTGRKGRYHVGVKKQEQPGRAEVLTCELLDMRAEKYAPIPKNGPKGMVQQCWAGQGGEGDMYHRVDGQAALSPHTKFDIKENKEKK